MRVVIGEDEPLLREGLAFVLSDNGFEVTAAGGGRRRAAGRRRRRPAGRRRHRHPDASRPHDDGLRAALDLRPLPVLLLSQHVTRRYVSALLADPRGSVGYLLEHRITDVPAFRDDLRRVARGGVVLDPEVVSLLVDRSARDGRSVESLTPRQLQVLALVAQGRGNLAIAGRLGITEKAAARHAAQIHDALGLPPSLDDHRRVFAVVRYLDH